MIYLYTLTAIHNRLEISFWRQKENGKELIALSQIEIKKDESFEAALRRFKKKIEQEGILKEVRDRKQ